MKLLRLGMKKRSILWMGQRTGLTSVVPFISVSEPYLRNMATHSWHRASFSPCPSHPPYRLIRLILTIWTCFIPGVSWHTQHLLCRYFCNKWLMSKQKRTYLNTNTTSQWQSQLNWRSLKCWKTQQRLSREKGGGSCFREVEEKITKSPGLGNRQRWNRFWRNWCSPD